MAAVLEQVAAQRPAVHLPLALPLTLTPTPNQVAAQRPAVHALIDAGALITGYTNLEVAGRLLPLLGAEFGGVVYLDEGDHKAILLRGGGTMGLERCGLPKERRFSFFDQVHTPYVT